MYRIPGTNEKDSIDMYETVLKNIKQNTEAIIGTDQNFDYLKVNHSKNMQLLNTFLSEGMIPTITRPTRVTKASATLIDNIYVSMKNSDKLFSTIIPSDMSDHYPCLLFYGNKPRNTRIPVVMNKRKITQQTVQDIKTQLAETDWTPMSALDCEGKFDYITTTVINSLDSLAPIKQITIPPHKIIREQWLTETLLNSSHTLDKLYKRAIGKPDDHEDSIKYKRYGNVYNQTKRTAKKSYYGELIEQYKGDISKTWKVLNMAIRKQNDKSCLLNSFTINN